MPDAVMLFAAGFGTRMGALTKKRPKPLIDVAGRPLVDHALQIAHQINPRRVVANVHYLAEQLIEYLEPKGVQISNETPRILETGGGLKKALPMLGSGPVFTLNTDAVWSGPNPLELLRAAWDPQHMDALLICVERGQALGHAGNGDFIAASDGSARKGPGAVYSGAQIINPAGIGEISDDVFTMHRLWDDMLKRNRLHVCLYPGRWCDVGKPEGIALAEEMLRSGDV